MKKRLEKLRSLVTPLLFLSLFSVISVYTSAQTPVCPVKVEFVGMDGEEITGASVTALNLKTKRVYTAVLGHGYIYFPMLSTGQYKFTVVKKGFKRSISSHLVSCEDEDFSQALPLPLEKGNPTQTAVIQERRLKIKTIVGDYAGPIRPDEPTKSSPGTPGIISGGVVNGKAVNLVKPEYPPAALAIRASGAVSVQVLINEQGNIISASAVSGHPLLRAASEKAARESKFPPTLLSGQPVKVSGVIIYNFQP